MAITQRKGGPRQALLIIVVVILAVIVGVYIYSSRGPAPTPAEPAERVAAPEAVVPGVVAPAVRIRPEALSSERITKILRKLEELDLILYGKLPVEVDPKEIGRANPFIAP